MLHHLKVLAAMASWSIAVTVAIEDPTTRGFTLAVFVATIACVPTFWLMIEHDHRITRERMDSAIRAERDRTDALILRVAEEFAETEIPRLRAHSRI